MTADPKQLSQLAVCFKCVPLGETTAVLIYLLDRIVRKKKGQ